MELEQLRAFVEKHDPKLIFKINFDSTLSIFFDYDNPFNYAEHVDEDTGMIIMKGYKDIHGNVFDLHVAYRAIQDITLVKEEEDKKYLSKRMLAF